MSRKAVSSHEPEYINSILKQIGLPNSKIAERLNVTPSCLTHWKKTGKISESDLLRLILMAGYPNARVQLEQVAIKQPTISSSKTKYFRPDFQINPDPRNPEKSISVDVKTKKPSDETITKLFTNGTDAVVFTEGGKVHIIECKTVTPSPLPAAKKGDNYQVQLELNEGIYSGLQKASEDKNMHFDNLINEILSIWVVEHLLGIR